jgi:xanthine dehydrogenase iron-sulfur cluster and FAD-binding subunit A
MVLNMIYNKFVMNVKTFQIVEKQLDPEQTLDHQCSVSITVVKGSKMGGGVVGCGVCTVMVLWFDRRSHKIW